MDSLPGPGAPETIGQGRPLRPRGQRHPHHRRRLVLLGTVLLVLVVAGLVVDHRIRGRESLRVDACARDAASAVSFASNRVDSIVSYVRPVLDSRPRAHLRRQMFGLVSISVTPTVPGVRRARERCAATEVLWFHTGADATRRDCLLLLDRDLAYLDGVTSDGLKAFASRYLPAGRCTG